MGSNTANPTFLTGVAKYAVYVRIAMHVAAHFARRALGWRLYPVFLYRALLFLVALRHSKVVRRGRLYKLHLYIPAYPTRAFFHALEKFLRPEPGPVTVVLSMTRACTYHCPHCYQKRDAGADLPIGTLIRAAGAMQEVGVSLFDIEGGEPLLRFDRLIQLLHALDDRAELWINTTGAGLTDGKLDRLVEARLFGVMVSLHTPERAEYDEFTGVRGAFDVACDAIRRFGRRGVFTAVNCCAGAEAVDSGRLDKLIELARELGCDFVQVIHPKSAGGWLGRPGEADNAPETVARLGAMHLRYNSPGRFGRFPSVSSQVFEEGPRMFGCTAGGVDRFYMGADGEVQPCEFLNVSFGNVRREPFDAIFRRMRRHLRTPCTDWLCCAQADSINQAIQRHGLRRTPVPWEITRELVGTWRRGPETPLYRKLGIYRQGPHGEQREGVQ